MTEELVKYQPNSTAIEAVIAKGDLSKLTAEERVNYYVATCRSLGLNELTQPFEYITLNGKLVLYAKKTATDQLRKVNGISFSEPVIEYRDELVIVTVNAHDKDNRTDTDLGAVFMGQLKGVDRANAIMKAITKAKRRVTLSICGLGWTDETEIETIPNAKPANVNIETGEIVDVTPAETKSRTNGGTKPEAPVTNGQPKEPEKVTAAEKQKRMGIFYTRIRRELPHYTSEQHIANTLKQLGITSYSGTNDNELYSLLKDHAVLRENEAQAEAGNG